MKLHKLDFMVEMWFTLNERSEATRWTQQTRRIYVTRIDSNILETAVAIHSTKIETRTAAYKLL